MHPYESLENVKIASPCTAKWSDMKGDEKVRHCLLCGLNVYNLSAMKRKDAEEFISQKEGRVCVRFWMRKDGTVVTADCPVGLRAVRVRLAKLAGMLAASLTVVGVGLNARSLYRRVARLWEKPQPEPVRMLMGDIATPTMGLLSAQREPKMGEALMGKPMAPIGPASAD